MTIEELKEENKDLKIKIISANEAGGRLEKLIKDVCEENQRLNNVLNELEKELEIAYRELFENELVNGRDLIKNTLNVLNELKESDK